MASKDNSINMDIDVSALLVMAEEAPAAIARMMETTATDFWGNVRREAPVDHGRLAGSFTLSKINNFSFKVESAVEYALAVNDGSKAHTIVPVNAKALYWPGAAHPVKVVHHPGNAANPYIDRAADTTSDRLEEFAKTIVEEMSKAT